jgi:peptide deformylase
MTKPITETMAELGIVQEGDPGLRRAARPLVLPEEAETARRIVTELASAARRVASVHTFGKGLGVAAPQIGIDRTAAVVQPPDGAAPLVLFNPEVIESGTETDLQFEGCLSFFDVRCRLPRALTIHVRHTDVDGHDRITIFQHGMARLVAHEIDHLNGILCKDHMAPGEEPLPIEQYRGTGSSWNYTPTGDATQP